MVGFGCQSSAPPPATTSGTKLSIDLPSPLAGPGRNPIDSTELKAITGAWADLLSGNTTEARARITRFSSPQAELLKLQIELSERQSPEILNRLKTLAETHPQFSAGWGTLSSAAESLGDERMALEAASRNSTLWPSGPLADRTKALEQRWITDRIERASKILAAGQPMDSLTLVDQALDLDPENQAGLLMRAQALVGLQQGPEAEAALSRLGALPEALVLRAELASNQGRWQHAMDLLGALPNDYSAKDQLLRRAQLMWRISILPPHVHEAISSERVNREQLAVILLAMVPSLEVTSGGTTPLMTDIIGLPSQRAILAAVRLDIMSSDRVAMLFHPQRTVAPAEAQSAIEAVCHLAGFSAPLWCTSEITPDSGCNLIQQPIKGINLVDILLSTDLGTDQ